MKNNMPDGPNPARLTPLIKKNNGITVIGPAIIKMRDSFNVLIPKSRLPV